MPSTPDPVLVVGTTPDYIERICSGSPGEAAFLTDRDAYAESGRSPDPDCIHVFASLQNQDDALSTLRRSMEGKGFRIRGVACFDCESLLLASRVAEHLSLPFPSKQAVINCRDKLASRRLWSEKGVDCPRAILARDEESVRAFTAELSNPVVMKPTSLSGSELTFICGGPEEAVEAMHMIQKGLRLRSRDATANRDRLIDEGVLICEEFIKGDEYSCDFIIEDGKTTIIRTARKHMRSGGPAGTVQAYEIPGMPAEEAARMDLVGTISRAAAALGLGRCMGMADFIIRDGRPYFLEITPRPGGDCLPQTIEHSSGFDILTAHLDFSAGRMPKIPPEGLWKPTVGLRVHADRRGRLAVIRLWADRVEQEILETGWYREPGERIGIPPEDYKTWVLGHVIFRPRDGADIPSQVKRVSESVEVKIA